MSSQLQMEEYVTKRLFVKGNEAVAMGALEAGCRYYFGYPITPQSDIPEYISREMPALGGEFIQAESEIASINMLLGASACGARAMTSSSSPGISLKQEGISYMAGSECPGLIVNICRSGPGLGGIDASQADYFQAVKGGALQPPFDLATDQTRGGLSRSAARLLFTGLLGGGEQFEFRRVANDVRVGRVAAEAEKMGVVFGKGADGRGARCKAEFLIKRGLAQHENCAFLDGLLPQGKTEQLGADALALHLRFYRQGRQMQSADLVAVVGG